jgi:hypothetical protein
VRLGGKRSKDKMNSLHGSTTLSEGEQLGIEVEDCEIAEAEKQGNNCLIGKIWAGKRVNKEGFISVFKRIWRTEKEVFFKEIQPNVWMFEFSLEADKLKVLEGRPWSFDRFILALTDFNGSIPSSQWNFSTSPFWIQIHDLPLICMTKAIGSKIGNSLGVLETVDIAGEGVEWGSVMRIRVVIDIQKPLERGRSLTIAGKAHWVRFQYENLPVFCFNCGRIAHEENGCPARPRPDQRKEWGVWLRAEKFRKQGLSRGAGRQPPELTQGRISGNTINGGWNQTENESAEIGGNPKPNQHPNKVCARNNFNDIQYLPKIAVGGVIAGKIRNMASTGKERISEVSQGKNFHNYEGGESAQAEKMGDPNTLKWVQKAVTGLPTLDPKLSGGPGLVVREAVKSKGPNIEELLSARPEKEEVAQKVQHEAFSQLNGAKSLSISSEDQTMTAANQKEKTEGQSVISLDHSNITGMELVNKTEVEEVVQSTQTVMVMGEKSDGKVGEKSSQEGEKNIQKIWKRAVRSGEGENIPDGSNYVMLGKRKGDSEGLNDDGLRHLKIRKWEDYLEAESENDEETAEAAVQPRRQP